MCGWQVMAADWAIDPTHDLADSQRQGALREQLNGVNAIMAAIGCSTRSTIREIPRFFEDGRPAPQPLRSTTHPMGLPGLKGPQKERLQRDNCAAEFILSEIQTLHNRGRGLSQGESRRQPSLGNSHRGRHVGDGPLVG